MISSLKKFDDIIISYKILKYEEDGIFSKIYIEISLIDNSKLIVKELKFSEKIKYSYHWMDKKNKMIIRWDNAPHFKSLKTFPHHKHVVNVL